MPLQFFQCLGCTGAFEVVGRGDQKQCRIFEFSRDQAAVGQVAKADGEIKPFRDQIDIAIGDIQFHPDLRELLGKARQ
ncbi:hypothetical protein D3C79_634750 [compost metagenome]